MERPRPVGSTPTILIAFTLSPFAAAQTGVVWSDPFQPPGSQFAAHFGIEAHPHGGAIALLGDNGTGPSYQPDRYEIRRLDENGDRLWSVDQPVSTLGSSESIADLAISDAGETAYMLQRTDECDVTLIAADGTVLWTRTVRSVVSGVPFAGSGVGFSDAGDVYVTGAQDAYYIPPFAGRASILQFDGATGQEIWRVDRVAINDVMTTFADGDAFFAYIGGAGWNVERFDASGTRVYLSPGLQPNVLAWFPSFITADDSGRVAIGIWEGYVSNDPAITMLDPAGNVLWQQMIGSTWGSKEAVITTSGDLVVAGYGSSRRMWRLDGTGSLLWQHSAPPQFRGYSGLAATSTDGVVVGSTPTYAGSGLGIGALETVDAQGMTLRVETFQGISAPAGVTRLVDVDRRGNTWVGISLLSAFGPSFAARTAKIVEGTDPSTPYCAPTTPNSTGALSHLGAVGTASVTGDNLTLVMDRLPDGSALFALNSMSTGLVPNAGGSQGTLCLSGSIGRYVGPGQVRRADAAGRASLQLELTATPTPTGLRSILAGETWSFQAWHRDANPGPTSNFTNGITVTFQ